MQTFDSSRAQTELDVARDTHDGVATRIFLQPIAAPSILGLFGFAGATFVVASNLAGWWGTRPIGARAGAVRRDVRRPGAVPGGHVGVPST